MLFVNWGSRCSIARIREQCPANLNESFVIALKQANNCHLNRELGRCWEDRDVLRAGEWMEIRAGLI